MRGFVLAVLAPLAACGDDDCCKVTADASPFDANDGYVEVARVPVVINRDLDLLFVIDDSPGMLEKQINLQNNFPNFINVLNGAEGGLPSIHIGVVTSDLGTKGADDATAGPGIGSGPGSCSGNGKAGNLQTNGTALVTGAFISDIKNTDSTRTTNYSGSLANAFSAIASAGGSGCGFEQTLEAAKRALNNNPANAGFLRATARLAIVLFSDEDDCSMSHSTLIGPDTATLGPLQSFRCTRFGVQCDLGGKTPDEMNTVGEKSLCHSNEASAYLTPIAGYEQFFKGLKADPGDVMVSAIVGPSSPVEVELRTPPGGGTAIPAIASACAFTGSAGEESADPAVRLTQLTSRFARHTIGTMCQSDLSGPLVQLASEMRLFIGDACLTSSIAQPPDCKVREETGSSSTLLPACNNGASSTNKPCYELVDDLAACPLNGTKVVVQRSMAPVAGTVVVVACRL
jgi:hypothetical protein